MKTTTEVHGVELIEDGDMVVHHQRRTGAPFEAESVAAWRDACTRGGTAVDVGAYTGLYAILAAQAGADAWAFDPNVAAHARLRDNARANGVAVHLVCAAVSDDLGWATFVGKPHMPLTSAGRIESARGPVRVTSLDTYSLVHVAAIKIDVEGHECAALRGALKTIERDKPLLITEALSDEALGDQRAILEAVGYTPKLADERNVIWRP